MTKSTENKLIRTYPLSRRNVLRATSAAGVLAIGGSGLRIFTGTAAAEEHVNVIETCGGDVDIVVALDYSGSIRSAGTWGDIQGGTDSFLGVVPNDVQLGLVTFGDAPSAFEYGTNNLLDFATASNVTDIQNYVSGLGTPPGENATHMPGALAFSNAILENEGRGGKEIIILITDGGPNYENGVVGDGVTPPADDTSFPYGDFEFTGGSTGSENGVAGEPGELSETTATADGIKADGRRIIAVGVGGDVAGFDTYLRDEIASSTDDFVAVTDASNLGSELEALISEVCEECVDCPDDAGLLVKYEFECVETNPETGDCVRWDFVPEGSADENITYTAAPGSFTSKDGDDFEPMDVTFDTEYCDLYVLVKSGQELEVQSFEDNDGSVTVETANDGKYAISFVAFYCTQAAAEEAKDAFPSGGRGR